MRVNNSGVQGTENLKSNQVDRATTNNKSEEKKSVKQENADAKTEISSKARELAVAKDIALNAPDVREAKIAELRRRIQSNEYNVKPDDIAEKMIKEHSDTKDL